MKRLVFIIFTVLFIITSYFVGFTVGSNKQLLIPVNNPQKLNGEKLTTLVNEWRVKSGFQPYEINQSLCDIAKIRTFDGLDNHKGFLDRYINYPSFISENLADYYLDESITLNEWILSPTHKDNLEKPYRYSCIATRELSAVQIFSNCENGCP